MFSASLLSKIERRIARAVVKRPMALQLSAPTVTFTFDDVPQSACVRGRALLERHDATGTFYVCGGYTGTVREQPMHTQADLLSVLAAGHELGCHGFAHLDHQAIGPGRAVDDMDRNRRFLQELGVADVDTLNFAYPFGCVNAGIKRVVHGRYRSARGVVGGQHLGVVDANLLGAVPLYDATITPQAVAALIESNARQRGWLVFFTHGVLAQPGPFDCSPTLLAHALAAARDTGSLIQSVQATMGPQRARAAQPESPIASRAA
jgi:peptidoglycan/xylan/chitin deacetylase (PgdA/CDA1 family)